MNGEIKVTGGARIGWVNASWPLARLSASSQKIVISSFLIGSYSFSPDQVAAIEPYGSIPILGRGIQVIHTVSNYPQKIVFWCIGSPDKLIAQIRNLGFLPQVSRAQVPTREGMAFRWSFIIGVFAIWNALFVLDQGGRLDQPKPLGIYALLAVALLFLISLSLNYSSSIQAIALKPGRSISEVKPIAKLTMVVSAILLIGFGVQLFGT